MNQIPIPPELLVMLELQGTLLLMILAGLILRRRGILSDTGQHCLTDVTVNLIIPCNILKSFFMELSPSVLQACWGLFLLGIGVQVVYLLLNQVLFRTFSPERRKIFQYATICSNAGFLGNPVAEGLYGSLGLLYNSVFLFPQRVVVWSVGLAYFTAAPSWKETLKKVLTHPCLVAMYLGALLMLLQIELPSVLSATVRGIGGCTATMTMLLIGGVLGDVDLRTILNPGALYYCALRLILLPLGVFLVCPVMGLDPVASGVAVLMTGMPAGSTTALFAARYGSEAPFAAKAVVLSILLSMVTLPLWRLAL